MAAEDRALQEEREQDGEQHDDPHATRHELQTPGRGRIQQAGEPLRRAGRDLAFVRDRLGQSAIGQHRAERDDERNEPQAGDQKTVERAGRDADRDRRAQREQRMPACRKRLRESHAGQRQQRTDREVDSARGNHRGHAQRADADDRCLLGDQRQSIAREKRRLGFEKMTVEPAQREDREQAEERRECREQRPRPAATGAHDPTPLAVRNSVASVHSEAGRMAHSRPR